MKKLVLLFAALCIGTGMQAQIVSSKTSQVTVIKHKKPKKEHVAMKPVTYIGAGLYGDGIHGEVSKEKYDYNVRLGYSLTIGHQFPLGKSRFYYAVEGGLSSRGANLTEIGGPWNKTKTDVKVGLNSVKLSPLTFGWKPSLGSSTALDFSVGWWGSYDLFGSVGGDDGKDLDLDDVVHHKLDFGLAYGLGVWISNKYYVGFKGDVGLDGMLYIEGENYSSIKAGLEFRYAF